MTNMLHMHAYLMCTPRLQTARYQSNIPKTLQYLVMRNSFFAVRAIFKNSHLQPIFQVPTYMSAHCSFIFGYIAPYQGNVFTFGSFIEKLLREVQHSLFSFSHYQQPASIFINAMHQSRAITTIVRQIFKMIYQRIDKRSAIVSVSWVYNHTRRLIHYQ